MTKECIKKLCIDVQYITSVKNKVILKLKLCEHIKATLVL